MHGEYERGVDVQMNYSRKHVKHIAYRFSFKDRVLNYRDWLKFCRELNNKPKKTNR